MRADDVPVAFDRLLPHLRGGLHPLPDGEEVVFVALGERGELPPPTALEELVDVVLAREQGFGTGAHPSTRHCIELLLDIEAGGSFADLGCGAGALSIAAFKLGFAPIVGIDLLDAVCLNAARNGDLNGIDADFLTRDLLTMNRLEIRVVAMNISELDVRLHVATTAELPEVEWLVVSGLDHPGKLAHAVATYEERASSSGGASTAWDGLRSCSRRRCGSGPRWPAL